MLTTADVQRVLSGTSVRYHFGTLRKAIEAAGLEISSSTEHLKDVRRVLSDDELFSSSVYKLEQELRHESNANEYTADGEYSSTPFKNRFGGKWSDTLAHYRKWKLDCGDMRVSATTSPVAAIKTSQIKASLPAAHAAIRPQQVSDAAPMQFYGEPFDFRGLRHSPINEQGVVYLFGMVSRELGFYVESIQQGLS